MKHILATLLLLTLAAPAWGQDFEKGMQAYNRGDYATALRELRPLAKQGNGDAQSNLGYMYANGENVPQDHAEAVKWYRKAAEQGYARAQVSLGVMYSTGQGVPQDYMQAHMWANLGATNGDKEATKDRDFISKRMTPTQIAEAQRLAREWMAAFERRKKI